MQIVSICIEQHFSIPVHFWKKGLCFLKLMGLLLQSPFQNYSCLEFFPGFDLEYAWILRSERPHFKGSASSRLYRILHFHLYIFKYIIKMDNTYCFSITIIPVPSSSAAFPSKEIVSSKPQHGQAATVSFRLTSAEIIFLTSLLGFLTHLSSDLSFSLPGVFRWQRLY